MKELYSLPLKEQETHIQFIREQLTIIMTYEKEILHKVSNVMNNNKVVCFQKPIVPGNCPTFDEETANYVRERLELHLKTWVLPNLNEVLNELSK